jgi:ketosteroid isomerase-like protein
MRYECHRGSAWIGLRAYALIACMLLSLAGCHRPPAEQAIRETIAAMQKAGNGRDTDALLAPLADDFIGTQDAGETFDRRNFGRYVRLLMMRDGSIHATLGPITVTVQGTDRATATFTAVLTSGTGLFPDDGQIEQVNTGWRLDGSKWKLISAEWKASGADR